MDPVQKAIWFVEGHLGEDFSLEDVAAVAGLSRFHLVRAFGQVTGRSVMRYVRARRLTEAARALAAGAPDILSVAIDAGYGSHEAFTRAFRDQFGRTPEQVRGQAGPLELVEPIKLDHLRPVSLAPPRLVDRGPLLLCGLLEHYRDGDMSAIPGQWQRFAPWIGHIPQQAPGATYGVVVNGDDEGTTDYLAGVEVTDFSDIPGPLSRLRLGGRRYAVWTHAGHISEIQAVWRAIWGDWVPRQAKPLADAPFFERYPESFDPQTGRGGFEIWLPVAA